MSAPLPLLRKSLVRHFSKERGSKERGFAGDNEKDWTKEKGMVGYKGSN
jgi:hypothetical protein